MYLREPAGPRISESKGYVFSLLLALIGTFWIGVLPQGFFNWAMQAAAALLP